MSEILTEHDNPTPLTDGPLTPTFLGVPNDWGWYEDGIDPSTPQSRAWMRAQELETRTPVEPADDEDDLLQD